MIKLKKFTAAALALVVFASFLMTHVAAEPNQFYEYMADEELHYFFENSTNDSYARVYGTVFGWNEETYTDFVSQTYAQNVYLGTNSSNFIMAEVSVGVYYDDEGFSKNRHDTIVATTQIGVMAEIDGMDIIDMDHGIEHFSSNHELWICTRANDEYETIVNMGPMITIGTSY
ncbi:MAG: hypothetical protein IJY97_07150 [Clostridia bacterium]|nr:hypothetical protein [Clostridia bacterium]